MGIEGRVIEQFLGWHPCQVFTTLLTATQIKGFRKMEFVQDLLTIALALKFCK
jgi:hypothetical protein